MGQTLAERIQYEAAYDRNLMFAAYAGDLADLMSELTTRAERAEAALKYAQRRAPPVGWRASFDKRGWFFFSPDQKVATPIFGTAEEAVAAIEDGRVFADLYEDEFRDRSPVSGLRAVLAELAALEERDKPCECGMSHAGPTMHGNRYCPNCGHPIKIATGETRQLDRSAETLSGGPNLPGTN